MHGIFAQMFVKLSTKICQQICAYQFSAVPHSFRLQPHAKRVPSSGRLTVQRLLPPITSCWPPPWPLLLSWLPDEAQRHLLCNWTFFKKTRPLSKIFTKITKLISRGPHLSVRAHSRQLKVGVLCFSDVLVLSLHRYVVARNVQKIEKAFLRYVRKKLHFFSPSSKNVLKSGSFCKLG